MNNEALRERYLKGEIDVRKFVSALLNSEEGDRRRRDIMARARQTAAERMLRKAGDKNGWTEPTGT